MGSLSLQMIDSRRYMAALLMNATMYWEAGARRHVYFNPQHAGWNLSTYNIRKYYHPVHHQKAGRGMVTNTHKCMLVNQVWFFNNGECWSSHSSHSSQRQYWITKLVSKTQEKDFYSIHTIWVLKHNICTLYKVSRAHFQMQQISEGHTARGIHRNIIQRSNSDTVA